MSELLQKDLGSSLLSIAVLLGWLGIGFVFLRVLTISIKRILEAVFKLSNKKWVHQKFVTPKTISMW